jgi:hypothetical protein
MNRRTASSIVWRSDSAGAYPFTRPGCDWSPREKTKQQGAFKGPEEEMFALYVSCMFSRGAASGIVLPSFRLSLARDQGKCDDSAGSPVNLKNRDLQPKRARAFPQENKESCPITYTQRRPRHTPSTSCSSANTSDARPVQHDISGSTFLGVNQGTFPTTSP